MLTRLFTSSEEASAAIRASPLASRHDEILGLLRPTILYREHVAMTPIGATRMGGAPNLPPSLGWPTRPAYPDAARRRSEPFFPSASAGRGADFQAAADRRTIVVGTGASLPFLAQIDLVEASETQELDIDLPRSGRLLFFYDVRECPQGISRHDETGIRVVWDDTPVDALKRALPPEELAIDGLILSEYRLVPEGTFTLPEYEAPAAASMLSREDTLAYSGLSRAGKADLYAASNFLGGWGDPAMGWGRELACALARLDVWPAAGRPVPPGLMESALRQQDDWCLLAEFDCGTFAPGDPRAEYFMNLWLYFWIERTDLTARRFDRVWVIGRR